MGKGLVSYGRAGCARGSGGICRAQGYSIGLRNFSNRRKRIPYDAIKTLIYYVLEADGGINDQRAFQPRQRFDPGQRIGI